MAETNKLDDILSKHNLTERELELILQSSKSVQKHPESINISNRHFKYGYFSDSHIGQKQFKDQVWDLMVRYFKKEKPEFIIQAGDILEGMSGRPGHIYELSEIGYDNQINKAEQLLKQLPFQIYGIDGNHDGWYYKKNNGGAIVGNDLEKRVSNYKNLGQMEGDLVVDGIKIKLFHANDGTAYATSYKLQKLIESFSGGEKPDIVHSGHYHKALYLFTRNVHGFESGTLCGQTEFMRGKKIPAHVGFGLVDVYVSKGRVQRLVHEFVPHYEK